tara:strand:- start:1439 stop:2143 length:705 start_codon:yes stop_codon:yes gene_type:complete
MSIVFSAANAISPQPVCDRDAGSDGHIGVTVSVARNRTVFNDGDRADYAYKVVSGAIRLCKLLPDGRRQIADFCLPGDYFGLGLQDDYIFSAETVSDAVIIRYPRRSALNDGHLSAIARKTIMTALLRELSSAQLHLLMLGCQSARERLASFLLMLYDRQAGAGDTPGRVFLPMGRQDVADYLGLTIETVSRSIGELKRCGVIMTLSAREIILCDAEALRELAALDLPGTAMAS